MTNPVIYILYIYIFKCSIGDLSRGCMTGPELNIYPSTGPGIQKYTKEASGALFLKQFSYFSDSLCQSVRMLKKVATS